MRALKELPDGALLQLAFVTNLPTIHLATQPGKTCARFWQYLGDVVAVEEAHRRAVEVDEPPFPLDLSADELERGVAALLEIAAKAATSEGVTAEREALATALRKVAADLLDILRDRLLAAGPAN